MDNASVMAARLRRYIPTEEKFYNPLMINTLKEHKVLTIEELIYNDLLPLNNEIEHLCYMYEKGFIEMNIDKQPLGNKTEVSLWKK